MEANETIKHKSLVKTETKNHKQEETKLRYVLTDENSSGENEKVWESKKQMNFILTLKAKRLRSECVYKIKRALITDERVVVSLREELIDYSERYEFKNEPSSFP